MKRPKDQDLTKTKVISTLVAIATKKKKKKKRLFLHSCLPHWTCSSSFLKPQPPGQPIGVTVHSTHQPIREPLLSSKPRQKLLKTYHPDKAQKPRLLDPIVQPIVVMPLRRT
ncbi:hypothetical protein TNCV_1470551 [Trichonephila clavipes]|nr:hypothetical protein TNCV_1470551 [Trichonephila clavipes]